MSDDLYVKRIINLLNRIPPKYKTKEQQLAYERGVMIGLFTQLAKNDSKNFDAMQKTIGALNKN